MVDLIDARTLRRRGSFRALRGFVAALAFSPHGRLLAATGQHGRLTLWDARTLRAVGELAGQHTTSQSLAFSPDGTLLAAAENGTVKGQDYEGGRVRIWDLRRRAPTAFDVARTAAVAFSPDGRRLALATRQFSTDVHDVRSGRLIARLRTAREHRSAAFSPDGRLIVTGDYDGTAQLWSTDTWKPIGQPLTGHDGLRLLWLGFTRDSTMIAKAGQDGTIELMDVASQRRMGAPLSVEPDSYLALALASDDRHLFAVSTSRTAVRWTIDPKASKQHACRVAGRELTLREWKDALPDRSFRAVCRTG